MTESETAKLIATAQMSLPSMLDRDLSPMVPTWYALLGDLDYALASAAVAKVLATSRFMPTVAEIREAAASLQPSAVPDAELAWSEALRAVQRIGYTGKPEWSHPAVGATVNAMWGSWTRACETMETETVGVDRAQFVKMYATISKREREDRLLPPQVRELGEGLAQRLRLADKGTS